ncbi:uncharacterized protein LOC135833258 isoform X5 [Planococcus citri]|uniref:uncharacterized protein LOC135833258 isoform X5 n=1 Tax=Planococcus citri TaxID=170843 RepID=UPI0031FA0040
MNVFNDIVKIVNQIRGKENIFGYKSTIANQFYLVYCFMGEIYFSTKFHRHTKFFMFSWQISGLLVAIFQQVSYIFYGDKKDFAALLYTTFITLTVFATHIIIPYFSVIRYRSDLQNAIQIADRIIMRKKSPIHKPKDELNVGKLLKYTSAFHIFTGLIFCLICNLNIVLFYEEEKVQNHVYYLVYVPRLDLYGSLPFFLIFNTVVGFAAFAVYAGWLMMIFILVFCTVIFYNEMLRITENLNFLSSESMTIESYKLIQPKFKDTIIKCTRDFQNAIKMIECFRGFYETLSALILPTALNIEITSAFLFVSPDISNTVRLRELSVLLTTMQVQGVPE